ncbi:hypothetical protein TP46_12145 [Xanthomonas citri pv. aurantifolii]|nr:hypothetical protein TP46_12145 [Xanthomonas citri pv. aurantifolii]
MIGGSYHHPSPAQRGFSLEKTMYNNMPYIPTWRIRLLHLAGKLVGIKFHIHGFPYGSGNGKYDFQPAPLPNAR